MVGLWVGCAVIVGVPAPGDTRGRADGADDAVVDALSEIGRRIGFFASEVIRSALSMAKSVRTNVSRETFAFYQAIRARAACFCVALRRTTCRAVRHAEDGPTVGTLVILRSTFPAKGLAKLGMGNLFPQRSAIFPIFSPHALCPVSRAKGFIDSHSQ